MSFPCCSICFNIYVDSDDIVITPCGHMYHRNCLLQWFDEPQNRFSNGSTCPKCRKFCDRSELQPVHLDFTENHASRNRKRKKKNKKGTNNENVIIPNSLQRCAPNLEPNSQPNSNWEVFWRDFYYTLQNTSFPQLLLMIFFILLMVVILIKEPYELILTLFGISICVYIICKSPH